jgi:uracil-DNA glycosylase family 4
MHGANRTGRPFTGDFAGILHYETLHSLGLATRPQSIAADDPLQLRGARIANAVKCVPPANKPTLDEIRRCNDYLSAEIAATPSIRVLLALGRIAHETILRTFALKPASYVFRHGAEHPLPDDRVLIDSYHCSRYNTQTGRLTAAMFRQVMKRAAAKAGV